MTPPPPAMPFAPIPQDVFGRWLAGARHGSANDRGRLLDGCRVFLLALAEAELGSTLRPKVGPSDLVQESLLEAQVGFEQFRGHTHEELLAWLGRILKNNVADLGRRFRDARSRAVEREVPTAADSRLAKPTGAAEPVDQLIRAEEADNLQAAIAALPPAVRDVILWRQHDRLGWDEIGRRLGKTPEAARKIWFRAIERLRGELLTP